MAIGMTLTNEMLGRKSTGVVFPFSPEAWSSLGERRTGALCRMLSPWIDLMYPIGEEKSTSQTTKVFRADWEIGFIPRTALGKTLVTLRAKAIAAGMRLLNEDEVLEEVKRRRGEFEDNEANLY